MTERNDWRVSPKNGRTVNLGGGRKITVPATPNDPPKAWKESRILSASQDLLTVTQAFRQKLATYVSVYPGDKELRHLLDECDSAIAKATGAQQ